MEKFLCLLKIVARPFLLVAVVYTLPVWLPVIISCVLGIFVVLITLAFVNDFSPWTRMPKRFYWHSTIGVLIGGFSAWISDFNPYHDPEMLDLRSVVKASYWLHWAVPHPWFLLQAFLGAMFTSYVIFFWQLEWKKVPLFFTPVPNEKKAPATDPY